MGTDCPSSLFLSGYGKMFTVTEGEDFVYEYITGTVKYISPEYIVVENNGIGYRIFTPNPYIFQTGEKKQKIYTYFHVREDAQILYGFQTLEEKNFFLKLIGVSGIGPKSALAILAAGKPSEIATAVEQENEKFLMTFPGVGKKTARQIILDLKGKLDEFIELPVEKETVQEEPETDDKAFQEAMLALEALGYSNREIRRVAKQLKEKDLSTDEYIKLALKKLSQF